MSQPHRLASGGLIERDAPLSFRFDGNSITGFRGDTLASALLANGVKLIGRSFKYHRPRGLLSAGPEEPNGLVELNSGARRTPNSKATTVELHDGLEATSQNRWPSLRFDLLAINSVLAPITEFAKLIAFDSPQAICCPNTGRMWVWYGAQVHIATATEA